MMDTIPVDKSPDTTLSNNRRIAKNTLMLYVRMLFSMVVSLYTSRVVLNTLGVEDYGIYNVVGGLVAMFSLVSNSLSASAGRFLTFELGRGDMRRLKEIFSTSLLIQITLVLVVLVLVETLGVWFLNTRMTIPAERLYAANWVFQASLLSFIISLLSVPYNASIIAHERMSAFAYIGILDVVLRLLIVLFIAYSPFHFDKLIAYSLLLVTVSLSIQSIYWRYCRKHFEECRSHIHFNKTCWKEMSAFAGWNFIGSTAGLLREQGVNVLLNLFMGPVVNAARGIAVTVNSAVTVFANNFMMAINPQITKSYAAGNRTYMFSLVERGTRFSFYILLVLALPVLFETEFILTLWLKHYPEHTVQFVRLVVILSMLDVLSNTLISLQNATGRIRNYQLVVGGVIMMNFPISYVCLKMRFQPESVYVVALLISFCCLQLRLLLLRKMVGLSVKWFLKRICLNVFFVTIVATVIPVAFMMWLDSTGFVRFLLVSLVSIVCSILSIYAVGCSKHERQFIIQRVCRGK